MRVKMLLVMLVVSVSLVMPALAHAWTVVVVNQTGKTIRELYVSHVETDDWETDVLRPEESNMRLMHNGQSMTLNLDRSNFYDLLAVFQDRSQHEYNSIDVKTYGRIILNRNDMTMIRR